LKDVWFARKKQKTVLNVAANAKTYTRMKQTRNFAEFWSSLFAEAQVIYLTFILITFTNTYKVKVKISDNNAESGKVPRMLAAFPR
jgi:hypothetical protein